MTKRPLKYRAYEKLKRMIISNQIPDKRPITELELSGILGMGRAPVREALNLLSKDGLIQLIPNKGAILRQFSSQDLIQIYKVREVLDPLASKQAIGRIDLLKLEGIKKKYLNHKGSNWKTGRRFSQDLHSLIYRSCGNPYLVEVFENLIPKIEVSRNSIWNLWTKEANVKILERRKLEHAEIIRALEKKDVEKVERISKKHITNAIQDTLKYL